MEEILLLADSSLGKGELQMQYGQLRSSKGIRLVKRA